MSPLLNKVYTTWENKPKKIFQNYTENGSVGERNKSRSPYHVDVRNVALSRAASADDLKNVMQYNRYLYYTKLHSQPGANTLVSTVSDFNILEHFNSLIIYMRIVSGTFSSSLHYIQFEVCQYVNVSTNLKVAPNRYKCSLFSSEKNLSKLSLNLAGLS